MASFVDIIAHHISEMSSKASPGGEYGHIRRYLDGDHDIPIVRAGDKVAGQLARQSRQNWLPLISNTYVAGMTVSGYRAAASTDNTGAWRAWQANGMDSRQSIVHRGALEFGEAFVAVAQPTFGTIPALKVLPATSTRAIFSPDEDVFPELAIHLLGTDMHGVRHVRVWTRADIIDLISDNGRALEIKSTRPHGMPNTPVVRFRISPDSSTGVIAPLIPLADRLNQVHSDMAKVLHDAAFRQRWSTGFPLDDDPATGLPRQPFEASSTAVWAVEDPDTKFGDFSQSTVQDHRLAATDLVRTIAGISRVSPNVLTGDLVNLSAEALAQLEASTQDQIGEYETCLGESWELVLRLCSWVMRDMAGATDDSAQVRWADTEARSFSQTVDGLVKLQALGVPQRALWEKIPNTTPQDIVAWEEMAKAADPLAQLDATLAAQAADLAATELQ